MIGFFNAHDCMVAARLVVSIHKGPIEASCYEWDPFEHELGEKFSETSRSQTHEPHPRQSISSFGSA
jgi:hypothetical protein